MVIMAVRTNIHPARMRLPQKWSHDDDLRSPLQIFKCHVYNVESLDDESLAALQSVIHNEYLRRGKRRHEVSGGDSGGVQD